MELKKNENRDLSKFRTLFRNVGLVVSLILTITAFEWKWENVEIVFDPGEIEFDSVIYIPPTVFKLPDAPEPPKPEPKVNLGSEIKEIDDAIKKEVAKIDLTPKTVDISKLIAITVEPDPIDTVIFPGGTAEIQAIPLEGMDIYYKRISNYCSNNINPKIMDAKGKVYVSFVVEKDGLLSHMKIKKGLSKRIDAIAIKSILKAGKWKAAKQSGRPVRQKLIMPISFQ